MAVITRGFGGRRRDDTDLPPGQYRTDDFSLVLLGRRHRLAPLLSALLMTSMASTSALVVRVPAGAGAAAGWPGGPCSSWAASRRSASVSSAASMPRCCK